MNPELTKKIIANIRIGFDSGNITRHLHQVLKESFKQFMKNAELPQFLTHIEHFEWKKRGLNSFSLIFSDIQEPQTNSRLIKILQSYIKVNAIKVWNLKLNNEFFENLKKSQWQIQKLVFIACNLGDSIGDMISDRLSHTRLIKLYLSSDRFSNRGLKKLMKLNLPYLTRFNNSNTNITGDGVKTVNKKAKSYVQLALFNIQNFTDMTYIKLGIKMLCTHDSSHSILFVTSVEFSQDQCPYLPWISKLQRSVNLEQQTRTVIVTQVAHSLKITDCPQLFLNNKSQQTVSDYLKLQMEF